MKPAVIIAIVIILALLGIGAMVMMNKKSEDTAMTTSTAPTGAMLVKETAAPKMSADGKSTFTGKLSDLFARADSQQCTLKTEAAGKSMGGTYYIASGRVRGDVAVAESGAKMNIIIKDKMMYYWSTAPAMAFKMPIPETTAPTGTTTMTPNQTTDILSKDQAFDCVPWALDESKFDLPTGVTFTSMAK